MAIKLISLQNSTQLNGLKICVYGASGANKTTPVRNNWRNKCVIISAESGLLSLRDADIK